MIEKELEIPIQMFIPIGKKKIRFIPLELLINFLSFIIVGRISDNARKMEPGQPFEHGERKRGNTFIRRIFLAPVS